MIGKRVWAICAGVSDYGAQKTLPNLSYGVNDACRVFDILRRTYNAEGVLLARKRHIVAGPHADLDGLSAGDGTARDIVTQINAVRRRMRPNDTFVFFFSGHIGGKPEALMPYGAREDVSSSHLHYRTLCAELSALPCRSQLLWLAGYHNGFPQGAVGLPTAYQAEWAAAPSTVLLAGTEDALYATTPLPAVDQGTYSVFTDQICDSLDALATGAMIDPHACFGNLRAAYDTWAVQHGVATPAHAPVIRPAVPEVRPGNGPVGLRKPGLHIGTAKAFSAIAGQSLRIALEAHHGPGSGSTDLTWELLPQERGFTPGKSEYLSSGEWEIEFERPGRFPFTLRLRDSGTNETTEQTVTFHVLPARDEPLQIDLKPLPICIKGVTYQHTLSARGGRPPYAWTVEGLPAPLSFDPDTCTISGMLPERAGAGRATAADPDPMAYTLDACVRDTAGRERRAMLRLAILSEQDYCRMDGGGFKVGYVRTEERDAAIRAMLQTLAQQVILDKERRAPQPGEVEAIAGQLWRELEREVLAANPGAEVHLDTFYIRKYPVTNAQWNEFVKTHPESAYKPPDWHNGFPQDRAAHPVTGLPYEAIRAYLAWKRTRLPTAWEWERTARGTDGRLFPWGDTFDANTCNVRVPGRDPELTAVDHYDAAYESAGICARDMVGNVAEWVDRRVFQARPAEFQNARVNGFFAQVFRGGSFLDLCPYALTFRDSQEAGLAFAPDHDNLVLEGIMANFQWVGFRDVVDLHADPVSPQDLIPIGPVQLTEPGRQEIVKVPRFAVSRYAVSNLEYWEFVQAEQYPMPCQWDLTADPPFPWTDRHLPVTDVTYGDALAFCLWKSRATGKIIRLPSGTQWLAAVRGTTGRHYPWGADFDLQRCNSQASNWGRRLNVHALPDGATTEGVFNLIGNVCEWVSPFEVRGGSWQDDCNRTQATGFAFRIPQQHVVGFHRNDVGFRYVENYAKEDGAL